MKEEVESLKTSVAWLRAELEASHEFGEKETERVAEAEAKVS